MKYVMLFVAAMFFGPFCFADREIPRLALVLGGDPKPGELLTLAEAKLFESDGIDMVERGEIDKVLAEQKLAGLFDVDSALQLGKILRADFFAVLEPTSIIVFDAKTGLRYADETLPENLAANLEGAVEIVWKVVRNSLEKRKKLKNRTLETYGVLEIRNADFPIERDAWCKAVAGMLERQLLRNGAAVLERSRFGQVNRERRLTGDGSNDLLASMKLIDLEFKRGKEPKTFLLTARVGDKVYRTESSVDKPLDAVYELARQLLDTEQMKPVEKEALRFQKESRFLLNQKRYEAAMEKAETAVALDPNFEPAKQYLILSLLALADSGTYPTQSGAEYIMPTTEHFGKLLRYAERAQDLIESGNFREGSRYTKMADFRKRLVFLENRYPEYKQDARRFHRRVVRHWTDNLFFFKPGKRTPSQIFRERLRVLFRDYSFVFVYSSSAASAEGFEAVIGEFLRLFKEFEAVTEASEQIENTYVSIPFKSFLRQFSDEAVNARNTPLNELESDTRLIYERTISLLEDHPGIFFQSYGWIARNNVVPQRKNRPKEDVRRYFDLVKRKIEQLPEGLSRADYSIFYDELARLVPLCVDVPEQRYADSAPNGRFHAYPLYMEIIELAAARGETSDCFHAMIRMLKSRMSLARSVPLRSDFIEKEFPRYRQGLLDYVNSVERRDPVLAKELRTKLNDELSPETLADKRVRPWKEERMLLSNPEDRIFSVRTRGNFVYYFTQPNQDEILLNSIDLKTFAVRKRQSVPSRTVETELKSRYVAVSSSWIDDRNIYLGLERHGIRAFPLDGDAPWSLTTENGLPQASVTALGSSNGFLYAGMGGIQAVRGTSVSWLVKIDLETKEPEILASSFAREGKTPFFNLSPAPYFAFFVDDVKRNRLLLFVDSDFNKRGIWAVEGETGEFLHVKNAFNAYARGRLFPDGERVLVFNGFWTEIYDLRKTGENDWPEVLTCNSEKAGLLDKRGTVAPSVKGFHFFDGVAFRDEYWGKFGVSRNGAYLPIPGWHRLTMDGTPKPERLATPNGIEVQFWNPQYLIPTSDEYELLVGDDHHLVLLRF